MAEKLVVLDGYTLNPGDISWQAFEKLGAVTIHDRTPADKIVERAVGFSCALTNKTPLSSQTFEQLPDLKYVGVLATGYNVVDVEAAAACQIVVTNVPTYGTDSVAQHATALMLELVRHVALHSESVHQGKWSSSIEWCYSLKPITELTGKTFGVIGIGRIGRAFARIAAAMGMKIIAHDEYWPSREQLDGLQVESVGLDDLLGRSDVITLHCPLTAKTYRLMNRDRLAKMKPTAILINTSRGPLVDNQALADALASGAIAGAGIDVLDVEPPPADNPLIGAPNCYVTPHISWYAAEARQRLMNIAADNYQTFLQGKPINVVSG